MSIIKHKDKRSGITYVYESQSYWDKEKQQPRSHRKLIGRLDDETGEIVPTGSRGRKKAAASVPPSTDTTLCASLQQQLAEKERAIGQLTARNQKLEAELAAVISGMQAILKKHADILEG